MKKTLAALVAGAALAGVTQGALAQAFRNEVSLFGSWMDIDEPTKLEQTTLALRYGRYFAPQIVGTLGLNRTFFEGGGIEAASTSVTFGAKYYVAAPRNGGVAPFLEAAIGVAKTDNGRDNSTDFTWEIGGGVSWFFTEATSFDAGLRLFHTDTDIETKGTSIFVGITTRF